MEGADTLSNTSQDSDSLISSLSGSYGPEFARLKHLVDPANYPEANRETELKLNEKIRILLQTNHRLEQELLNANNQVKRLIESCKDPQDRMKLERSLFELRAFNSNLLERYDKVVEEKKEAESEILDLKVTLNQLTMEKNIKNACIKELKGKIANQQTEIYDLAKEKSNLKMQLYKLTTELKESSKLSHWCMERLKKSQSEKADLENKLLCGKKEIGMLNQKIEELNIELQQCQSSIHLIKLEGLKEAQPIIIERPVNNHNQIIIDDLTKEIDKLRQKVQSKDSEIDNLTHKHSSTVLECLVLEHALKQKELELQQMQAMEKLASGRLKTMEKMEKDISELRTVICQLRTQLQLEQQENREVEAQIRQVKGQFFKLKAAQDRLKADLHSKNQEILSLKRDKQELFVENNNWSISESEEIINILDESAKEQKENGLENELSKVKPDIDSKNSVIHGLKQKFQKQEWDWRNYLERITDDQKLQLLSNNSSNYIKNFIDNLNIDEFESAVNVKLRFLDERVRTLKTDLVLNKERDIQKIRELEILVRVKERQMLENRKKTDRNSRTLLRKVKEHMIGRSRSEKELKLLQNLYDALVENHGLILSSKDLECDNYKKEIEELRMKQKELDSLSRRLQNQLINKDKLYVEAVNEKERMRKELEQILLVFHRKTEHEKSPESENVKIKLEIEALRTDRSFLQRLCNDLKMALRTYQRLSLGKCHFNLLSSFELKGSYDETFIANLIKENRSLSSEMVLRDVQIGLSGLNQEVVALQRRILYLIST